MCKDDPGSAATWVHFVGKNLGMSLADLARLLQHRLGRESGTVPHLKYSETYQPRKATASLCLVFSMHWLEFCSSRYGP